MKKLFLLFAFACLLMVSSCRRESDMNSPLDTQSQDVLKEKVNPVAVPQGDALTVSALDKTIVDMLRDKKDFRWQWVDVKTLWSALQKGDHVAAVGYKPAGIDNIETIIDKIDIHTGEWKKVHDAIIKLVLDELNKNSERAIKPSDIIVEDDEVLPIITFRLSDKEAITK